MDYLSVVFIGIGLSFDTFAVSISCGIKEKNIQFFEASRIALFFATFQALMPVIGWLIGLTVSSYVMPVDHWLAFGLLWIIGLKMIWDAWHKRNNDSDNSCLDIYDIKIILTLSLATTIDAFVIGFTLAFLDIRLPIVILIIGFITYLFAMLGMLFGKKLGQRVGDKIEILGGVILMTIGLKILLEHLQH